MDFSILFSLFCFVFFIVCRLASADDCEDWNGTRWNADGTERNGDGRRRFLRNRARRRSIRFCFFVVVVVVVVVVDVVGQSLSRTGSGDFSAVANDDADAVNQPPTHPPRHPHPLSPSPSYLSDVIEFCLVDSTPCHLHPPPNQPPTPPPAGDVTHFFFC